MDVVKVVYEDKLLGKYLLDLVIPTLAGLFSFITYPWGIGIIIESKLYKGLNSLGVISTLLPCLLSIYNVLVKAFQPVVALFK